MLDALMIATGLFGTWRTGSVAEPPGWWDRLLIGSSITDWVMAAVTVGLLVTSIVLGWSTTVTARRGRRAYLSVDPQGIVTLIAQNETLAHIGIRNTGHLPAKDVFWRCHIEAPNGGDRQNFPITRELSGSYIVPGGTVVKFGTHRIPAINISSIPGADRYCCVWGEVRYKDGFEKTRFTKFCHRYPINVRTPDGTIDSDHARYHDYGNEAD